jgi:hypothetical protein
MVVAAVLLLAAGGGTWWLMKDRAANSHLPYTRESFLAVLKEWDIQVEKSAGTNAYVLFDVPQESELGIWTEQGSMEVIFFPTVVEGTVTVTQTGEYSWELNGLGQPVNWGSNRPWYILAHRNVIIMTDSEGLYRTLEARTRGR